MHLTSIPGHIYGVPYISHTQGIQFFFPLLQLAFVQPESRILKAFFPLDEAPKHSKNQQALQKQ